MAATISYRPDPSAESALRFLEDHCGMTRSEAIRRALVEMADRRRRFALAEEAAALAADEADRQEKLAVTEFMDSLSRDSE